MPSPTYRPISLANDKAATEAYYRRVKALEVVGNLYQGIAEDEEIETVIRDAKRLEHYLETGG